MVISKLCLTIPVSGAAVILFPLSTAYVELIDNVLPCPMYVFYWNLVTVTGLLKNKIKKSLDDFLQKIFFQRGFNFNFTTNTESLQFNFRTGMIGSWAAITVRGYLLVLYPRLEPSGDLNQSEFTSTVVNTRPQFLCTYEATRNALSHYTKTGKCSQKKSMLKSQVHIPRLVILFYLVHIPMPSDRFLLLFLK